MQRTRSTSKNNIVNKCGIAFSELRLFVENHSLELHEIWRENTLGNTLYSSWSIEKNWTLTEEILDIPVNLQQGMIKDLSVKLAGIVACLLHANCKDNLTTRYVLQINKTDFEGLHIFIDVAITTVHTSSKLSENRSLCYWLAFCHFWWPKDQRLGEQVEWNTGFQNCVLLFSAKHVPDSKMISLKRINT